MNLPQMVDFFNKDLMEKQMYEQISAIQWPSYKKESDCSKHYIASAQTRTRIHCSTKN